MDDLDGLRRELVGYVRRKFGSRPDVAGRAEDIVQQAFASIAPELWNFGYLAKACLRLGYKVVADAARYVPLIDADTAVDEIAAADDTAAILQSLETLTKVQRIVIEQRYYGQFSFDEIAAKNALNLNTVLSHHRRALAKLRSVLAPFFAPADRQRASRRKTNYNNNGGNDNV
jgi:RNA polymerase sigma-70 factor (ECF subfamily)